eukprot:g11642.t1
MHFSQFGTVQKVDMKYDPATNGFRGFCFVTLGSVAEAQAVFANYDNNMFNGSLVLEAFKIGRPDGKRQSGRWIDCKPAALGKMAQMSGDPASVQPMIPTERAGPTPTGTTLRARGLPFSATKEQVEEFFAGYGMPRA